MTAVTLTDAAPMTTPGFVGGDYVVIRSISRCPARPGCRLRGPKARRQ